MRIAVVLFVLAGCAATASCNSVEVAPILDDAGAPPPSTASPDAGSDGSSDASSATDATADAADAGDAD